MTSRDTRGAHVLDATIRVVASARPEDVSVRRVASEAGVSIAQVQYYFRSKDELLLRAFERVCEASERAIDDSAAGRPPLEALAAAVEAWLPLDDERRAAARVWLAFTQRAMTAAPLAELARRTDRELRGVVASALREAASDGALAATVDPDDAAHVLLALVDGLTSQLLVDGTTGETAVRVLRAHVQGLAA